jgi:ATP-dependent HslUV protease ATP-binding subunit HslU
VGKTEIARRLASLVGAPFVKVEATKFTEVGYYGRDVESLIRDLVESAVELVKTEMADGVKAPAADAARDRILDALLPDRGGVAEDEEAAQRRQRTRDRFAKQLDAGELDDREVEIKLRRPAKLGNMTGAGPGMELDPSMQNMLEQMLPDRRETKRMKVLDARRALEREEAEKLVDTDRAARVAVERVEESGIVFLDEIDKVVAGKEGRGADVSRQGVQRDLLPIVEGSTVTTKHGLVRTDHILFIAAGAFHGSEVGELMPELQGRFPIRVTLDDLDKGDFVRILTEPRNALLGQQVALLDAEGLKVSFADDAIDLIAQTAFDVNRRQQNIGARRLYTIVERVLEELSFEAPDRRGEKVTIDAEFVRSRLGDVLADDDVARFIL